MNRISQVAVLAALYALPVLGLAQDKPAADKPAAPMKAEAKAEKPMAAPAGKALTAKSREDARECLQFPTNQEVIVCAEKFM